MLVVSIGFGILLRYTYLFVFGGSTTQFAEYSGQAGLELGPISITPKSLIASGLAIIALLGDHRVAAELTDGQGQPRDRRQPWPGVCLGDRCRAGDQPGLDHRHDSGGPGGIVYSLSNGVTWIQGFQVLLLVFAGVIVGGLGTAYGALVGCLLVGVLIQMSTLFIPPELKNLGALVFLILILLVRPQGILGRAERIG